MRKALEKHRLFPFIAWITIVVFAFFVYTLVSGLQNNLAHLDQNTTDVEASLQQMKDMRDQ